MIGGQPDELGDHRRRMREVGIHLHDEVRLHRQGGAKALLVRRPDPEPRAMVHEMNAALRRRHLRHQRLRSVGRAVIDDDDVAVGGRQNLRNDASDVLSLVVRRDDDDRPGHDLDT